MYKLECKGYAGRNYSLEDLISNPGLYSGFQLTIRNKWLPDFINEFNMKITSEFFVPRTDELESQRIYKEIEKAKLELDRRFLLWIKLAAQSH